jgi:mannan endo-1,4-beta-mannosidase
MRERGAIVGAAFWGWAGEGRKAHGLWQPGDEFIAETPSEYQGWNSVYDSDFSTTRIVTRFADTFAENLALAVGIPSGPSRK